MAFVDEEQSGLHARDGQAPPVLPDGSYVFSPRRLAVPGADGADAPTLNPGETGMRFEACLQLHGDREGTGGPRQDAFSQARATRVRVVLLGGPGDGRAWDLRRVEVGCSLLWRSLSCKQTTACMTAVLPHVPAPVTAHMWQYLLLSQRKALLRPQDMQSCRSNASKPVQCWPAVQNVCWLVYYPFMAFCSCEDGLDRCSHAQVHRERYVGEYNGGKDLCGCGGGMSPFASQVSATAHLQPQQ